MSVFTLIAPLLLVACCGFGCSRSGWFSREQIDGISRFAFSVSIPLLLFSTMLTVPLKESLRLEVLFAFYLPVISLFWLMAFAAAWWLKRPVSECAALGLGSCYSNTLLVGLPLIMAAFGPEKLVTVFLILPFHSAVLFGMTFALSGGQRWQGVAVSLLRNPVVASLTLGIIGNLIGFKLPALFAQAVEMLAQPAIVCALFVLGANMHYYKLRSSVTPTLVLSVIKLFLLPATVCGLGIVLGLTREELAITTLLAASPLGVNAYLIACQLERDMATIAATVLVSSCLSVISSGIWLMLLVGD
ncbi:malonate transporter [Shewanella sp. NFH-SH190041]|uniref:AEC family transporter n=1 Tax=Shewanella sp. NFH-SH190041 TaxID=2950245 RepID=UPI0021C309A4|nr:AEC family transporter [Shewanella sp. NFH-SH190041]BDM63986.1 malonate transporter [Shewanella sp. NFH-SH190041]